MDAGEKYMNRFIRYPDATASVEDLISGVPIVIDIPDNETYQDCTFIHAKAEDVEYIKSLG